MKQIICQDIKRIIISGGFWTSVSFVVISVIINLLRFEASEKLGVYGLFIFGSVSYNPLLSYIAPFIPAIAFSAITIFSNEDIADRSTTLKKYILGRSISSMIAGGSVFLFAFMIILLGCFVCDSSTDIIYYEPLGLFKEVYFISIPIYILLFIAHSALFGALYALFGVGTTLVTKSDSMGLVLPGIIYHSVYYIGTFISQTILSFTTIIFPVMPFNFAGLDVPIWKNTLDLGMIIIVSVFMIIIGYIKLKKARIQPAAKKK